jgi:hypothetical protein
MFEELAVSPTITTQLLAHTEYGVRSKLVFSLIEYLLNNIMNYTKVYLFMVRMNNNVIIYLKWLKVI